MKAGTVYETTLPAGTHEFSTKVKFKMFATGLLDKAFSSRGEFAAELEPWGVYYLRAVPVGDMRILAIHFVAKDFGPDECNGLSPAKPLKGNEEE